ncbi:hypothetical protein EXS74_03020 [Candidatus Woesearchaeota archaeon]|nr:hypothetical protein [Candidatus Woesearchaeota archaeon]
MNFKDCVVVVGTGAGNQYELRKALLDKGYSVLLVKDSWPRDHYVLSSPLTPHARYKDGEMDWAAEGGYFRWGRDVVLASDLCLMPDRVSSTSHYSNIVAVTKAKLEEKYPEKRVYVLPTGYFHSGEMHAHLDMFTLYLPQARLLVVDAFNLRRENPSSLFHVDVARKIFEELAVQEDLSLVWYDSLKDRVWWPLNSAVLPCEQGGELVVLDEACFQLRSLLDDYAVPYLGVPCIRVSNPGGKINCATNTLSRRLLHEKGRSKLLEELSLEALI